MDNQTFINTFLYPSSSSKVDIGWFLNPFGGPRQCASSSDSSSYQSDSDESDSDDERTQYSANRQGHDGHTKHDLVNIKVKPPCNKPSDNSVLKRENSSRKRHSSIEKQENYIAQAEIQVETEGNSTVDKPAEETGAKCSASFTQQISEDVTSPLNSMDLIDIILKHGVHRELKSLNFRQDNFQGPTHLSPVKESSDDSSVKCPSKMLHFQSSVIDSIRESSMRYIPIDGLKCSVFLLYASPKDRQTIELGRLYAKFDVIEDAFSVVDSSFVEVGDCHVNRKKLPGEPVGLALASYILSENTPEFILDRVKAAVEKVGFKVSFLLFYDVMSENLAMECFEFETKQPMMYNLISSHNVNEN